MRWRVWRRRTAVRCQPLAASFRTRGPPRAGVEDADRAADRPGGYTRVIQRHQRRLGDGGKTAFLELLKEGETRVMARTPGPAPAPQVEDEEETETEEGAAPAEGTAPPNEAQAPTPENAAPPQPGESAATGPEGNKEISPPT